MELHGFRKFLSHLVNNTANAQTQNLATKADLQNVFTTIMTNIQSIFATKTELHDTADILLPPACVL